MLRKNKAILIACLLMSVLVLAAGCAAEKTPYENNDAENFTVSVKFDANGGTFTTNSYTIVDSFDISSLQTDSEGMAHIALISPDSSYRGNDAFTPIRNGYFLAGWYAQKTETLDENGEAITVYGQRWDFENDLLAVDAAGTYTSAEPVLTLYAAWVPLFEIEFYDLSTGELLLTRSLDPTQSHLITLPAWNVQTGCIEMNSFPEKEGFTYTSAYYDPEGTRPVSGETISHCGTVDYVNGGAKDPVQKLYVDYVKGQWYHIYNVEQFLDNASVSGSYVIHADLDFADEIWPTSLMYGSFTGTIQGNGYTLRNIAAEQTNNSKVNAGLFGQLTESASISDLTFENVTFTLRSGTRVAGASFGLLTGTLAESAQLTDVTIVSSRLQIDSDCYFGTDDYAIGLVCGMGTANIDHSGIACEAVGEDAGKLTVTANGNTVSVRFADA